MDKQTRIEFATISQLFQAGKVRKAKAAVLAALRRNPRAYFLHNIHGAIDGTMGNWKDARKHFQKALKVHPKSFESLRNLGNAERKLGDLQSAQKNLMKAVQLNPRFDAGWCSLGNVYLDKAQIEKAIEAYRKALRIRPDFTEAAINLLTHLDRSNQMDELRIALEDFERASPGHPVSILYKGILLDRAKDDLAAIEMLNSVEYEYQKIPNYATLELARLTRLAKINDRQKNPDIAYDLFLKANQLNNKVLASPYVSPSRFTKILTANQAYLSSGFSQQWEVVSQNEEAPVFMVGFPRSGTTLLDTFLRGHSDVSVIEERPLVLAMRTYLGLQQEPGIKALDTLSPNQIKKAGSVYLKEMKAAGERTKIIIDKLPLNLAYAGEILRIFPKAKFILSLRDPADAVFSCFMQSFQLNDAMATFDTPENAARTYDLSFNIWQQAVAELAPTVITCRYEDLILDPEASLRPIIAFLGMDWDGNILNHLDAAQARSHIATSSYAQVVQPLYTSAVARWTRYKHLMPEALEILAPWRAKFGYSD